MLVQRHNDYLLSVYADGGEDVSEIYRIPSVTEIIRYNTDGTTFTHIRATGKPVICHYFDINFMRVTFRRCHIWFLKVEFNGKVRIPCGEFPIPVDEMQFAPEQMTYQLFPR